MVWNHKYLLAITLILSLIGTQIYGQQQIQYTQIMFNKYQFNPAYAGFDRSLSVTGVNRSQWAGFSGAPTTQNINAHMPFYLWNGAIGISLDNDKIGSLRNTSGSISYSFVYASPFGLIGVGARAGVMQTRLAGNELITPDGVYEPNIFQHNDPILPNQISNGISPIWSIGAYFLSDAIEVGISIADLPGHSLSAGSLSLGRKTHINAYFEYFRPLNDFIDIMPSIFVKTDLIQTQIDINALARYQGSYFGGIGLRGYNGNSLDAVQFIAGFKFSRKYTFSYSYDLGLNGLRKLHEGTHEFVLNYNLSKSIGVGLPPEVIYNPRFL